MAAMIETILLIAFIHHCNEKVESLENEDDEDAKSCTWKNPFKKIDVVTTSTAATGATATTTTTTTTSRGVAALENDDGSKEGNEKGKTPQKERKVNLEKKAKKLTKRIDQVVFVINTLVTGIMIEFLVRNWAGARSW